MQTLPEAIPVKKLPVAAAALAVASLLAAAAVLVAGYNANLPRLLPAVLLCVTTVLLVAVCFIMVSRHNLVRGLNQKLDERLSEIEEQNNNLKGQIEVLAAMREVIRIISEHVNFYRIVDQVFLILERLLKTEEICLIVKEENGGLVAKALRRDGKMLFEGIAPEEAGHALVKSAIATAEMQKVIKDCRATIVCPLIVDKEVAGAIKFVLTTDDVSDDTYKKISHTELAIHDIATHIALSIKTPSLHERAVLDGLTGLYSRSHFENQMKNYTNLARRYGKTFALIMMDIDHFKLVNDLHGHLAGDVVLNKVAALIKQSVRDCDSVYRYGGEEITVILPETSAVQSQVIAERLRLAIANTVFMAGRNKIRVTVSQGLAELNRSSNSSRELISRADQALYAAKAFGRNKTCIWKPEGSELASA